MDHAEASAEPNERWDIFLSHNKADKDWARNLASRLEREELDPTIPGRKIRVFFDEWDIDVGDNVVNRLNEGLTKSRFMAVLLSPEFLASGWTNLEWTDWVAQEPRGKNLIPILYRDVSLDGSRRIQLPAPFRARNYIDFRNQQQFSSVLERLLRRIRGLKPPRGAEGPGTHSVAIPISVQEPEDSWDPDQTREVLIGNMLEVRSFPSTIWHAPTEKPNARAVREQIPDAPGHIVREKRLWTFSDLTDADNLLRQVIDIKDIRTITRAEWLVDRDKLRWLVDLLNQSLTSYLSKLAIKKDRKGRFYFRPNKDGTDRTWKNRNDQPRTVAARKFNPADKKVFWVHHAARIRFSLLAGKFFLNISPTIVFTQDGEQPFDGREVGRLAIKWVGRQRNDAEIRNVIFWTKAISKSAKEVTIETGSGPIVVAGIPATTQMSVGVEVDHVRIGSLLGLIDDDLDEAARNVEVVDPSELGDEDEEANDEVDE